MKRSLAGIFLLTAVVVFPRLAAAQSEGRRSEIAGFAGITTGLPSDSTKWNYGGAVGFGLRPNLALTGEVARTRLLSTGSNSFEVSAHILEATAGVQYLLPVRSSFSPFVGGALGLVRVGVSTSGNGGASSSDLTVNLGGGARFHLSPKFGLKPEIKLVHIPGDNYFRAALGVFYQFGN